MSSDKPLATPPSAEERAKHVAAVLLHNGWLTKAGWYEPPVQVIAAEIRSAEQARDEVWRGKLAELEAKLRQECRFHDGCSAADKLAALRKESGE